MRKKNWMLLGKKSIKPVLALAVCGGVIVPSFTLTGCFVSPIIANDVIYVNVPDDIQTLNIANLDGIDGYVSEFNAQILSDQIQDLYGENSQLSETNTESIKATKASSDSISFDVQLKPNFFLSKNNGKDNTTQNEFTVIWKFGIVNFPKQITNNLAITNPTQFGDYVKKFEDISTIEGKISTLFGEKSSLSSSNTKSIGVSKTVDENGNDALQFTVTLNGGFLDQQNQSSHTYVYECAEKIILPKPTLESLHIYRDTNNSPNIYSLATLDEYKSKFNELGLDQKINWLFGFGPFLNNSNTKSIDASVANNQIEFAVVLKDGYAFENASDASSTEANSCKLTANYFNIIPTNFTISAYGNDQTFAENFNKLPDNTAKLKQMNVPILTANADHIKSISATTQNSQNGYLVTLNDGCSFSTTTQSTFRIWKRAATVNTSSHFFPFNGNGKVTTSVPFPTLPKTITSFQTIDECITTFNDQFKSVDEKLGYLAAISNQYGLSSIQVANVELKKNSSNALKLQFNITLNNGYGFASLFNPKDASVDVNYVQSTINYFDAKQFYKTIVLPTGTQVDKFITDFNALNVEKQGNYLFKNKLAYAGRINKFKAEKDKNDQTKIIFTPEAVDMESKGFENIFPWTVTCQTVGVEELKKVFDNDQYKTLTCDNANGDISLKNIDLINLWEKLGQQSSDLTNLIPVLVTRAMDSVSVDTNGTPTNTYSVQVGVDASFAGIQSTMLTNHCLQIGITNSTFNQPDVLSSFETYAEISNNVAKLFDHLSTVLVPQNSAYATVSLKNVLTGIASGIALPIPDELSDLIVYGIPSILNMINTKLQNTTWQGKPILQNYAFTPMQFKAILKSIFANGTIMDIANNFLNAVPNSNKKLLRNTNLTAAITAIAFEVPKMVKLALNKIDESPLPQLIKQPLVSTLAVVDVGANIDFNDLLTSVQPLTALLGSITNIGILDIVGGSLGVVIKSGLITKLLNAFTKPSGKEDLNNLQKNLQIIYDQLYPVKTSNTVYPTNQNNATVSTIKTDAQKKVSVGFNLANCAYRNLISPDTFIKQFINAFLNNANTAEITSELIQKLASAGIVIDPSNVSTPTSPRYVQFKLNTTELNNPYLEMNLTSDQAGKAPIDGNITTYLSLNNLNAVNPDAWFGNQNYQGGLFNVSLYNTLLGNKDFIKAMVEVGFGIGKSVIPQAAAWAVSFLTNKKVKIGQNATSDLKSAILSLIDSLGISGENVYDLVNSFLGTIERAGSDKTNSYSFMKQWIIDASPYTISFDPATQTYIYQRTYNFGKLGGNNGNKIGTISLTSLTNLLGTLTINQIVNLLKASGLSIPSVLDFVLPFFGNSQIKTFISKELVLPQVFSLTDTLYLKAIDVLNTKQTSLNVSQTVDLNKMSNLFDNIFGMNVSGENNGSKNAAVSIVGKLETFGISFTTMGVYNFSQINGEIKIDFKQNNL